MSKADALIILTPGFAASEADVNCLPMLQNFVTCVHNTNPNLKVIVVSLHYPFEANAYSVFGVEVNSLGGKNKGGIHKYFLRRKAHQLLNNLMHKNHVIGVLSFWYGECALIGNRFANDHGIKHFCWLQGQDAKSENRYPAVVKLSKESIVALSDFLQDEFEINHGVRPGIVIPPGIDVAEFFSERDIDLMAVGSLIPLKQFDIFIETLAEVKKQFGSVKALLVGEGSERKKLAQLIMKLNLGNNLTLTGDVKHPEVLDLMQRTKTLLHPSSYEGFSGVCLEALSKGAHVISFCRAMNKNIDQWHVVQHKNDMIESAIKILQDKSIEYKPVQFQSMDDTAKQMMALFTWTP